MRRRLGYPLVAVSVLLIASCSTGRMNLPSGDQNGRSVYFVPIGDISSSTLPSLVAHYHEKFGLKAQLLTPMQLDSRDYDSRRNQFVAELLIRRMQEKYPAEAGNPKNIMIGITDSDIYTLGESWLFCFGLRADAHLAVVSAARLNVHYRGQSWFGTSSEARLRKVVTKDLGLLYFGRSPSNDPRSVLYNHILGVQELDEASEDF